MPKRLPPHASLRQLKAQAKDLRKACEARDPEALARFRQSHPRYLGASDDDLTAAGLSLQEAQLVIAREYGFDSWPKLADAVGAALQPSAPAAVIIGASNAVRTARERLGRAAASGVPVLLVGERGVGKRHAARALHDMSARSGGTLETVGCNVTSAALVECEIFGFEEGAFTGALVSTPGKLEQAGTLVLDEVGDLSPAAQVRLLEWMESGTCRRLGGSDDLPSEARIACTTSQDLRGLVESGAFREDLYFWLQVMRIDLPPLRDRREDIPELVRHFAAAAPRGEGQDAPRFSDGALALLAGHHWPGNVRELRHVVEAAVFSATGAAVDAGDLRLEDAGASGEPAAA